MMRKLLPTKLGTILDARAMTRTAQFSCRSLSTSPTFDISLRRRQPCHSNYSLWKEEIHSQDSRQLEARPPISYHRFVTWPYLTAAFRHQCNVSNHLNSSNKSVLLFIDSAIRAASRTWKSWSPRSRRRSWRYPEVLSKNLRQSKNVSEGSQREEDIYSSSCRCRAQWWPSAWWSQRDSWHLRLHQKVSRSSKSSTKKLRCFASTYPSNVLHCCSLEYLPTL